MKAPLNSIMGLIDIAKGETEEAEILSYLNLINKSVVKLEEFLKNLADFSSNERDEVGVEEIELNILLKEIIAKNRYLDI